MRKPIYWMILQQAPCQFLGNLLPILLPHSPTSPLPTVNSFETLGQLQPCWKCWKWFKSVRIHANHEERDPQFCSCWGESKAELSCWYGVLGSSWLVSQFMGCQISCSMCCISCAVCVLRGTANWGYCNRQGRANVRWQRTQVYRKHSCVAQGIVCSFTAFDLAVIFHLFFWHHIYSLFYLFAVLQNQTLRNMQKIAIHLERL